MTSVKKVRVGNGAVGINGTVAVKARIELFIHMYDIAKEHRDRAKQAAGTDIQRNILPEIKESMISILFSYTCLEAYINTIGKDSLGTAWHNYEGSSTEAKWRGVSKALATKKLGMLHSVFSSHKEPFKSFLELEKIRNDYLVHRKPEFANVVETKYGRTEGTVNVFNCDKAEWACSIVKDMVKKLSAHIEDAPSTSWVD
ncbi:hypothetical protein ACFLTL_01905 [Chloroflexota bacterium]